MHQVAGRTRPGFAEEQLLRAHAAECDLHHPEQLRTGTSEPLLAVAVRQQPERVTTLDDREHLELAILPDEVRDRRVTSLVGCNRAPLFVGVLDRLLQTDLLGHLRLLNVGPVHGHASVAQRPHEALVEDVLDHHRRVSERHCREGLASLLFVELRHVRLAIEVVVDDVAAARSTREVEVDRTVETPGTQERGVEIGRAVRRRDEKDVRRLGRVFGDAAVRGQQPVQ